MTFFTHRVYLDYPTWQVVFAFGILVFIFWGFYRKPKLREAVSNADNSLNEKPLFFFSNLKGLLPLNDKAFELVDYSSKQEDLRTSVLLSSIKDAISSKKLIAKVDWFENEEGMLVVIPVSEERGSAIATITFKLDVEDEKIDQEIIEDEAKNLELLKSALSDTDWILIDSDARLHRIQGLLQIKENGVWSEYRLNHYQYQALFFLQRHARQTVTGAQLNDALWPDEPASLLGLTATQKDRLRQYIYQLRQIHPAISEKITTVRGIGYMLQAEVS